MKILVNNSRLKKLLFFRWLYCEYPVGQIKNQKNFNVYESKKPSQFQFRYIYINLIFALKVMSYNKS